MKKFLPISAIMLTALITITSYGATERTINAIFGKIKLNVNGKQLSQETLLYNGTTYVPIRTISENMGMTVNYDSENYIAYINANSNNNNSSISNNSNNNSSISNNSNNSINEVLKTFPTSFNVTSSYGDVITGTVSWECTDYLSITNEYRISYKMEGSNNTTSKPYYFLCFRCFDKDGYEISDDLIYGTNKEKFRLNDTIYIPYDTAKLEFYTF